ncbi:MAG: hypothetical protein AB7O62_08540 [Pirellulales bacterium]
MEPTNGHNPTPDATADATIAAVAPAPVGRGRGGIPGNKGNQQPKTGNRNAFKHGGYARVTLVNMPAKLRAVQRSVNDLRAALEAACVESHGDISLTNASTINTAVWGERLLRLWARRLAQDYDKLDATGVALATDRIERLCKSRDDAIRRLNLDKAKSASVWDSIYQRPKHPALALPATNGHAKPATVAHKASNPTMDSEATPDATDSPAGQQRNDTTNREPTP